ncbi:hypothetical protein AX16_007541 [Volvariella volvacea WC 439]|nr:hypothetical protein AX16_007541 [Volvariella volvacea WC 439]
MEKRGDNVLILDEVFKEKELLPSLLADLPRSFKQRAVRKMPNAIVETKPMVPTTMPKDPEQLKRECGEWFSKFYHMPLPPVYAYTAGSAVFGGWTSGALLTTPPPGLPNIVRPPCGPNCCSAPQTNIGSNYSTPVSALRSTVQDSYTPEQLAYFSHIQVVHPQAEWAIVFVQGREEDPAITIRSLLDGDVSCMKDPQEMIPTNMPYIELEHISGQIIRVPVRCPCGNTITRFMLATQVAKFLEDGFMGRHPKDVHSGQLVGLYTVNGGKTFKFLFVPPKAI